MSKRAIVRSGPGALRKVLSGGGEDFGIPMRWSQASYGSGWPIKPVNAPKDADIPRSIDYPISVNASLTPRTSYGLMPFASLLEAYENVTEVRNPVNLIYRQLSSFKPHLINKDKQEVTDHPFQWLCESPDGKNPFGVWMTRFIKNSKVYDAASLYWERGLDGHIKGMHYIDGSTLFLIVDEHGNTPEPEPTLQYIERMRDMAIGQGLTPMTKANSIPGSAPVGNIFDFIDRYKKRLQEMNDAPPKIPAYTQVIKGTPYSWWSADQIWYIPQSRRMNAPYGESFIESAWTWIMMIVNITAFELGHYRTGNMPEGFVTMPPQYNNPDKLMLAELMFNARMSSNPATERMRLRMFPDGTKYFQTKKGEFPSMLYTTANRNILHAIGVPPSEYGDVPGQGLGGTGFKDGALSDLDRNTLNPHRDYLAAPFNFVLDENGVDDVRWELAYPLEEIDPDAKKKSIFDGMAHGTISLNDALGQLNLSAVGDLEDRDNPANKHLIVAGANIYVIEDMKTSQGMAVPSVDPKAISNALPAGPETAAEQAGAEHTPEDHKTIEKLIKNVLATGSFDGVFHSVPKSVGRVQDSRPISKADEVFEMPAYGLPASQTTPLDKHCGVCAEDDDYFNAPISRSVPFEFPNTNHVNGVEVVAMCPPGLPTKAALWKPEGMEKPSLQQRVGGPQYVREEAGYLLDRSLGTMLVPVAYVTEANDEEGAAVYYTFGMLPPRRPDEYGIDWIERAAIFDYVASQQDRGYHHNYGTHPDDPDRMILFDNGLSFPIFEDKHCRSPFCDLMLGKPLSDAALTMLVHCKYDVMAWNDITALVGPLAAGKAKACLQRLLNEKMITAYEPVEASSINGAVTPAGSVL